MRWNVCSCSLQFRSAKCDNLFYTPDMRGHGSLVDDGKEPDASATNIPGAQTRQICGAELTAQHSRISLKTGQVVADRYEITCFIGRGGMGEVYAATDKLLHEQVALKIIRPDIAADEQTAERFKREIQLARKVSHPNVCRIFDIGRETSSTAVEGSDSATFLFLTMELIDGETLAERIRTHYRLSIDDALPIFKQVAQALIFAHKAGVIHGDLKPGNVMLAPAENGVRAVITDFGLAVSSVGSRAAQLKGGIDGKRAGTPEYMSPEQLKHGETTEASDIYSFGVSMYVTLTGELPFSAAGGMRGAMQRLGNRPTPPNSYLSNLDKYWSTLLLRCLANDPAKRFPNATSLAEALDARPSRCHLSITARRPSVRLLLVLGVASLVVIACFILFGKFRSRFRSYELPSRKQIAVIPFNAIDGDTATAAFGKGLAETLTAHLTRLTASQDIQVVPAAEIRGSHIETVQQARREFGVNLGIEGSVERYRGKARITFHLVDATSLKDLYGNTLTETDPDPFVLEDRVVSSVENALDLQLSSKELFTASNPATVPAAYDFYLQGRGYLQDYLRSEALDSAIQVFLHAIRLDPNYSLAYAGLGQSYWYEYEETRDPSMIAKAQDSCTTAIRLQPEAAQGHICLGTVQQGIENYSAAAQEFSQAVKVEPTSDEAIRGLALTLAKLGKQKEAEEAYKHAIRIRPNYWAGYNMLGVFYFQNGDYRDAETMFRQVMELSPDNYRGPNNLGGLYLLQSNFANAIPLLQRSVFLRPTSDGFSNLGSAYFFLHRFTNAADNYHRALAINQLDYLIWGNLAEATVRIPNKQREALALYAKAIALAESQLRITPDDPTLLGNLALYSSMTGAKEKALVYAKRALGQGQTDPYVVVSAAEVFEHCGDVEEALHLLSTAVAIGYSKALVRASPSFEQLSEDPRFQRIVQ